MRRSLVIALFLLASVVAILLSQRQTGLFLVARQPVPVYLTEAAAKSPALASQRTLPISERVEVITCIDAKHYMIYQVRLSDGSIGFINDGQYVLERPNGRVTMSCQ